MVTLPNHSTTTPEQVRRPVERSCQGMANGVTV
jgi:hypothetical protein